MTDYASIDRRGILKALGAILLTPSILLATPPKNTPTIRRWNGCGFSDRWDDPCNWEPVGVPGRGDTLIREIVMPIEAVTVSRPQRIIGRFRIRATVTVKIPESGLVTDECFSIEMVSE